MFYIKKEKEIPLFEQFESKTHVYTSIHDWELCTFCNKCNSEISINGEILEEILKDGDLETTKISCEKCSRKGQ